MRPTLVYWRRKMGEMDADLDIALSQSLTSSGVTALGGSTMGTHGNVKVEGANNDQFPAGLRVLVVDDDPICLLILDRMLRQCLYKVTTCGTATKALALLRENKDEFDLVISDVCMPDMDGFKLLEHVGLEMDLPVIMMSANGETSAVMKGITHGACDYLLKPVRMEELRNIWQHVVRKKRRESEQSVSHEDEKYKRFLDDCDHHSTGIDGSDGPGKHSKKRKDVKEEDEDVELENDDSSSTKKPRVVWSVDLHQQFVGAVNQLGIDKAVPKRILELMNVQGLTRENVASHLQKYRLYLKRISGVNHQPVGLNSPFAGAADSSFSVVGAGGLGSLGDVRALAASGQLSPQALVTLQAGLLGRLNSSSNSGITGMDPSLLLQIAALQGVNSGALIRSPYGLNGQGNLHQAVSTGPDLKQLAQGPQQMAAYGPIGSLPDKGSAGISALQQLAVAGGLGSMGQLVGVNNNTPGNPNNNALMMQILQQQAGSQLTNGGGLNVPLGGLLGQHMLSNDIGTRASPLSPASSLSTNTGTGTGVPCVGQLRQGHGSSVELTGSSSPVLGTVGKTSGFDNKSFHLPRPGNVSISLPVVVNVSSTLTSGVSGELCATGMKSLGTSVGGIGENVPQSLRGSGSSFAVTGVNHGPGLNLGSSGHQGWQGLSSRQDLGQASSPVLSPRYSQASSNSQGLNIACGQEQGQVQASGFANQGMVFPGRFGVDSGRMKPARPHSEQSTAESELKVKEGTLDLMVGSKAESGLLPESFSSSDDLLNLFFKQQQQEGLGFTEAELGTDNYGLDNMYVK